MKKSFYTVAAVLTVVFSAVVLCLFAFVPVGSLWKGYVVLYISSDVPEENVLSTLHGNGAKDVITLSDQRVPIVSLQAPVQPQLEAGYIERRSKYFFDRSANMQLYYVPEKYAATAKASVMDLNTKFPEASVGLDLNISYPWIVPVVCAASLLLLVFASPARLYTFMSGLFPLLYSFCVPVYTGGAAVVLLLYAYFISAVMWRRHGMTKVLAKSLVIWLFGLLPLPVVFMGSLMGGVLFLLVYVGTASLLYLFSTTSGAMANRRRFSPVPIRPASMIPVVTARSGKFMLVPIVAAGVLCVSCIFSGAFPASAHEKDLYIPVPTGYTAGGKFTTEGYVAVNKTEQGMRNELPNLTDYLTWVWNTLAFPYRPLWDVPVDDSVMPGDTIEFPSYSRGNSGMITESTVPVYVFNDEFVQAMLDEIDSNPTQIEFLLKEQGGFVKSSYAQLGNGSHMEGDQSTTIILLLLAASIPAIFAIFIWRTKR